MLSSVIAIDSDTHINHGTPWDSQETEIFSAMPQHLRKVNLHAGIDKMLCSTFASVLSSEGVPEENEYLHQLVQEQEYLYQWVVLEPRIPETYRQAERMLQHEKCVGIKLHPLYHKYALEEYGDTLFSFASRFHAVVQIHPEKEADYILPLADRYPDVTMIVAHLGSLEHIRAVADAKHGNVWTDTSGIASSRNNLLEYAVSQIGSERILFGTDTYAAGFQRGRVDYAMISDEDKENILRNNALRLFGEKLK